MQRGRKDKGRRPAYLTSEVVGCIQGRKGPNVDVILQLITHRLKDERREKGGRKKGSRNGSITLCCSFNDSWQIQQLYIGAIVLHRERRGSNARRRDQIPSLMPSTPPQTYLNNSGNTGEGRELIRGTLTVSFGQLVQQSRLQLS